MCRSGSRKARVENCVFGAAGHLLHVPNAELCRVKRGKHFVGIGLFKYRAEVRLISDFGLGNNFEATCQKYQPMAARSLKTKFSNSGL
jgi:hypothetical protein